MIVDCHTHVNNYHDENVESVMPSFPAISRWVSPSLRRYRRIWFGT